MIINPESRNLSLPALGGKGINCSAMDDSRTLTYVRRAKGWIDIRPKLEGYFRLHGIKRIYFPVLQFDWATDHGDLVSGRLVYFPRHQSKNIKYRHGYFTLSDAEYTHINEPGAGEISLFMRETRPERKGYLSIRNTKEFEKLPPLLKNTPYENHFNLDAGIIAPEYHYIEDWGRLTARGELSINAEFTRRYNPGIQGRSKPIIIVEPGNTDSLRIGTYIKVREEYGKVRIPKQTYTKFWSLGLFRYIYIPNFRGYSILALISKPYSVETPSIIDLQQYIIDLKLS